MKLILLTILLIGIATVFAQNQNVVDKFTFRVANHLGPDLPANIAFKSCGLPNVYVNIKNTNRVGFGLDIPAQANPNILGICPNGCGGSGSRQERDSDEVPALYASDSVVNFNIFWHEDDTTPDRVLTRISQGAVAYVMGPGSTLNIASIGDGNDFTNASVPSTSQYVLAKNYPQAVFNFYDNNRMVMQNWYLEAAAAPGSCTPGAANPNDLVTTYSVTGVTNENIGSLSFKSRVRFDFDQSEASNGLVSVSTIWNSSTQHFETHIRGDEGAGFNPSWISNIDVKIAITGSGVNAMIDDTTEPTGSYIQNCADPSGASSALLSKKK